MPRTSYEDGSRWICGCAGEMAVAYVDNSLKPEGALMEQRKMIDIPIGTKVKTSFRAPIDGDYELVEHNHPTDDCKATSGQFIVYRGRGELLPSCPVCGLRGIWELMESRFDISPERDNTPFVLKQVRGDRPNVTYPSGTKR